MTVLPSSKLSAITSILLLLLEIRSHHAWLTIVHHIKVRLSTLLLPIVLLRSRLVLLHHQSVRRCSLLAKVRRQKVLIHVELCIIRGHLVPGLACISETLRSIVTPVSLDHLSIRRLNCKHMSNTLMMTSQLYMLSIIT